MKCLNCQTAILEKIQVCHTCEANYTNAEIVEMLQLQFLLTESLAWPNFSQQRAIYAQRWQDLQHRLKTARENGADPSTLEVIEDRPTPEPIPVSQWLFSETMIKLALYGGGFLLVLAGLIFIGATWSKLPMLIKLLVTLTISGVMYSGGLLLLQLPKLRTGGLALLGVASGFIPLNFIVLHIYLLKDLGLDAQLTWLIGSAICVFIYIGTTLWTRSGIFAYLSLAAALSAITAFLNGFDSPFSAYILLYALFPAPFFVLSRFISHRQDYGFLYWPALITSIALLTFLTPFLIGVAIFAPEIWLITSFLIGIILLYSLVVLITGWETLLLIALLTTNLLVISGYRVLDNFALTPLTLSYALLGSLLLLIGVGLRLAQQNRWLWPFYTFALFNLTGAYVVGLFLEQPWPILLSFGFAILALGISWVEQTLLDKLKLPPISSYVGLLLIFIGHFYLLDYLSTNQNSDIWPVITATLCSLFILAHWFLPLKPFASLYGQPLYWVGASAMFVPAIGVLSTANETIGIVTFIIIGSAYILDGVARGWIYQVYLGTGVLIGSIWSFLLLQDVDYLQAYVLPLGLWLLALAWVERYRQQTISQLLLNFAGLFVILASTFGQSIDSLNYALLLLFESLIVLSIGFGLRSRTYVFVGIVSLLLNGLVQFMPALAEIPRFIQVGSIGTSLLCGGLIALLFREQILTLGHNLHLQLQEWGP